MSSDDDVRAIDLALADECRLNVLWLAGVVPGGRALEVTMPTSLGVTRALASLFTEVEQVSALALESGSDRDDLPFADQSFDLACLYGRCPSLAALRRIRRMLRTDGLVLLAFNNRLWKGNLIRARASNDQTLGPASIGRLLIDAGFSDIRGYWAEPSLEQPRYMVPMRSQCVRAYERIRARESGGNQWRLAAALCGIQAMLYPVVLLIAKV
jgi:SAM-dependent methyltransferase